MYFANIKSTLGMAIAGLCFAGAVSAAPITLLEDGFVITGAPDDVSSSVTSSGGFGPNTNTIDGDLSTGFPNLSSSNPLTYFFTGGLTNGAGAELLIVDGRYDASGIELSLDNFGTFTRYEADAFYDTGVDDALTSPGGSFSYSAFALLVDLSDLGVTLGGSISSFSIRSDSGGFDPIDVATIRETGTPVIPLPAGLPLILTGMAAFAWMRRER